MKEYPTPYFRMNLPYGTNKREGRAEKIQSIAYQ